MSSNAAVIDQTTVISLSAALALLITAYLASLRLLPNASSASTRVLFIWHAFDALVHFLFEGSFLYNCFFTFLPKTQSAEYERVTGRQPLDLYAPGTYFLGVRDRVFGSSYGGSPAARLWQTYARADARWGGADLTVISLELLTVFIGGPLAAYVCFLLAKGHGSTAYSGDGPRSGKLLFWMTVLATGELYGGFMTFAPEWLSGSPNLDTSNFMHLWVYLVFFNMLWVIIPFWILYLTYDAITRAAPSPETKERKVAGKSS